MSKEIKFRAWDVKWEFMTAEVSLKDLAEGFAGIYGEDKIVMQYTGLKDKKGKEIYEGDIIIIDNKHASLGSDIIKTVLFKNGMFGVSEDAYSFISLKEFFVGVESTKKYISNYGEIFEEYKAVVEVIGNIYKNPELIRGLKIQ